MSRMGGKLPLRLYHQTVKPGTNASQSVCPVWQSLLTAIVVAAVIASALEIAFQFWLTPLGWSAGMLTGLFAIGALVGVLVAGALGAAVGLPLGRLLARRGRFAPVFLMIIGALLGTLCATLFSALGNTYEFMSGFAFWRSFTLDGAMGALIGLLWWLFEKRRNRQTA